MMALETERCSPQNASSPGPNEVTQNPGTNGGSSSSGYSSPVVVEPSTTPIAAANITTRSKSAFHQIALLTQKYTTPGGAPTDCITAAATDRFLDERRPSPVEYYSAAVTPTSVTTSTPPPPFSNLCSPSGAHTRGALLSNESSSSSSPELANPKEVHHHSLALAPTSPLSSQPPPTRLLQPAPLPLPQPADLIAPTLPSGAYACPKFTPEMYISQIQNFHAAAAAGALPFNPFMFPATRLPALKMQLYNSGVAPAALNMTANDYMLGLHNAKLMCEMLQIQQQQHYNTVFERGRSKPAAPLPHNEPSTMLEDMPRSPSTGTCSRGAGGAFTPPASGVGCGNADLYSRPDSPCSSVNSSKYYYKQSSCSPSSTKGAPSRSPSPVALCQGAATSQGLAAQPPTRPLPFSVDNILRPEFGKSSYCDGASTGSQTSNGGSTSGDATHLKLNAAVATAAKRSRASSPTQHHHQLLLPRTKLPKYEKLTSIADDCVSVASSTKDSLSPRTIVDHDENSDKMADDASSTSDKDPNGQPWPAWVYCTRYSDRPSSGPRSRRVKRKEKKPEEKRPRTAFSGDQLSRLKKEFDANNYLNEKRRQELANELGLHEAQIKIWFQNKRAKMKKQSGVKNPLALQLMAQGLYNHSTVPMSDEEMDDYHSGASNGPATPQTSSAIKAQ